jgi:hypothetical protein
VDAGPVGAREPYDHDMTVIEDIIESIENRLGELNEEIGATECGAGRARWPRLPGNDEAASRARYR